MCDMLIAHSELAVHIELTRHDDDGRTKRRANFRPSGRLMELLAAMICKHPPPSLTCICIGYIVVVVMVTAMK